MNLESFMRRKNTTVHGVNLTGALRVASPLKLYRSLLDISCLTPNRVSPANVLWVDYANAVSEANGPTVSVSLDAKSSLSIQPLEGSRSRVQRTRVLWEFNRILPESLVRRGL